MRFAKQVGNGSYGIEEVTIEEIFLDDFPVIEEVERMFPLNENDIIVLDIMLPFKGAYNA